MAKLAIKERELKREKLVAKYAAKRAEIKEKLRKLYSRLFSPDENQQEIDAQIEVLQIQLDRLPRNSSKIRLRRRCRLTGRPRGVFRRFKLCRNMIRKYASMGWIPGLRKASW